MSSAVLNRIDPPEWMARLYTSLDDHDFSLIGGLSIFSEHATMLFGDKVITGSSDIVDFFVKTDQSLETKHVINAVWNSGDVYLMQGSAELRRANISAPPLLADPLLNIFWMTGASKIEHYVVSYSPRAAENFPL